MISNILDRISFYSLFAVIVFLPIFFLPFSKIPIETSKGLILVVGLTASIIFWSAARFTDGKVTLPKSTILMGGLGVVLVVLVSAFFSSVPVVSFFGIMLDVGTFWFMLSAFLLMLISSIILREGNRAKIVLLGILFSTAILFLFQILRFTAPEFFSLGVLGGKTENLIGSFNSLGLFAGFSLILSLFLVEFFQVSKLLRWLLFILSLASLVLIASVNFPLIWKLVGFFALIIFVYKVSISGSNEEGEVKSRTFPVFSFIVVMLSLLFLMSGQFIGGFLPNRLGISNVEVRPSLSSTVSVSKQILQADPIFCIGPNRWNEAWAKYKPEVVNSTQFWDMNFTNGSGLIPTFMGTTGGLGILAWAIFLVLLLVTDIKILFSNIRRRANFEYVAFFIGAIYLLVASFFYSVGSAVFLLSFAFIGAFIGLSSKAGKKEISFSFLKDPRKSFFYILFLVIIMILSAGLSFKYIERFASVSYFAKTFTAPDFLKAEENIDKAILLHPNDLYFRTSAKVFLSKLNFLINKGTPLAPEESEGLQAGFNKALNSVTQAIEYNKENYLNFNSLGVLYSTVATLGETEAHNRAIEAYMSASLLSPGNPGLKLTIARSYMLLEKNDEARNFALEAITLKQNYIEALITLSQIERVSGNNSEALSYAEQALALSPTNNELIQYVDSLRGTRTPAPAPIPVEDNAEENNTEN